MATREEKSAELTDDEKEFLDRIFKLVDRAITAYEVDVATRRAKWQADNPHVHARPMRELV